MKLNFASVLVAGMFLGLAIVFFNSFPIMWIWNWLMPDLFGLKPITWPQALALGLLARFIWGTGNATSSN